MNRKARAMVTPVESTKESRNASRTAVRCAARRNPRSCMLHREKDIMAIRDSMATSLFIFGYASGNPPKSMAMTRARTIIMALLPRKSLTRTGR